MHYDFVVVCKQACVFPLLAIDVDVDEIMYAIFESISIWEGSETLNCIPMTYVFATQ